MFLNSMSAGRRPTTVEETVTRGRSPVVGLDSSQQVRTEIGRPRPAPGPGAGVRRDTGRAGASATFGSPIVQYLRGIQFAEDPI